MKIEQYLNDSNDLGTGILKYTSGDNSGTISIAVSDEDYASVSSVTTVSAQVSELATEVSDLSGSSFILKEPNEKVPNAQALNELAVGILKVIEGGAIAHAEEGTDYAAADILGNLAVDDTTIQSSSNKDIVLSPDGTGKSKVMGIFAQKGVANGYTGSDIIRGQTAIQTTNNTKTTLLSIPVPATTPNKALICRASLVAISVPVAGEPLTALADSPSAGAYYTGSSASYIYKPSITLQKSSAAFDIEANWNLFTQDPDDPATLVLEVTGLEDTAINWVCSYEYYAVTLSTN